MIETPLKPPPAGGPPAAPPPDPRTRAMEPPPDPTSRYEFACRECGAPLHADQAACLTCGAMVEDGDGGIGLRRAVTGSAGALLLLGVAVGAAIAGLPSGKHVGKNPPQVFALKPRTLPPATITPTPGGGSGSTTPLTGSTSPKKPPPIHSTAKPHKTSTTRGSGSSSGSSNKGSSPSASKSSGQKPSHGGKPKPKPKPALTLFTSGEQPAGAGLLTNGVKADPDNVVYTYDNDVSTAWRGKKNAGVWVQPQNSGYKAVGLVSKTPGYAVSLYYTSQSGPPPDIPSWTFVQATNTAGKKERIDLSGPAKNASYYLIVLDGGPAKINEIQLIP
jgi:hypothetical protein